uniref:Fibrinogen C-terminal domain-containing protein n=1 Tax=Amphimedon queenslandica TaxID=400682 RepID=A0A1X7TEJ2_AMPQE
MAEELNDQLNDKKKWNFARIHTLVFFILDIAFCVLFLFCFFPGTITIYQSQETGCISNIARDCKELYDQGHTCSGVYTIKPDKLPAFEVYCDMSNGSGWTVFQRRMDGSVDFYRKWTEYVKGFGDLNGEFWLGLNKIHRLTATDNTSLRVDLKDFEGVSVFAHYSKFIVGDAHTKYTLTVGGYSGNPNDSLSGHNSAKFSTHDRDNDK